MTGTESNATESPAGASLGWGSLDFYVNAGALWDVGISGPSEPSRRQLAAWLQHLDVIVTALDGNGNWLATSGAGPRILGWPPGIDPEGGVFSFIHPDDIDRALEAFTGVVTGARPAAEPLTMRVMAADGAYKVLETVGKDLTDDPDVGALLLMSRDVTEFVALEATATERAVQLTALLNNFNDAVLYVDDDYKVVFVNQVFCDMWGYSCEPHELVGLSARQRRPGDDDSSRMPEPPYRICDSEGFLAGIESAYTGRKPDVGVLVEICDGRTLERDYVPVERPGLGNEHLWVYRDVTSRTAIERERAELLEIERTNRELAEGHLQSTLELNRLKADIVAGVSHELRTPLTSIIGSVELLMEDVMDLDEAQQSMVDMISRNAQRLLHLVEDLTVATFEDLQPSVLDREPVSAKSVLEEAISAFERTTSAKSIEVDCVFDGDPSPLLVEPEAFSHAMRHLVSNAVKFTPDGGRIHVSTGRAAHTWVVRVEDTGIGIEPDQLDLVRERFRTGRAESDAGVPGAGLGLAVVAEVARRHGGELIISSEPGVGTMAEMVIPDPVAPGERDHRLLAEANRS